MEAWRKVWREGFCPNLTNSHLEAIRHGIVTDDKRLQQGCTTTPPPLQCVLDWPCEGACLAAWAGWMGGDEDGKQLSTVGDVEEYFARLCHKVDCAIGEPAGVRYFLNWFDDTPRDEVRRELLAEVLRELAGRPGLPKALRESYAEGIATSSTSAANAHAMMTTQAVSLLKRKMEGTGE